MPGLLLIGAGMGLGIAPLATIIMSAMRPEQAGAASGTLSTFQNVGNAIGVAVIGVVFFGALHSGFARRARAVRRRRSRRPAVGRGADAAAAKARVRS